MPRIRFRPSKTQLIIFGAIVLLLVLIALIYRQTSLWEPDQSLIALLPSAPICYVSVKDLGSFVETFQRSEFGKRTAQMPILGEIRRELWWRRLMYQKQRWELEMGGKLDLKRLQGYLGEEAILSVYNRGGKISFLLVSALGAQEKLEIATLTATGPINPKYKRLKESYRKLDINTITGYPEDFSYAFIGKIGLLATDKSLIQDTIDIYAEQKQGFTASRSEDSDKSELVATGDYLSKQYDTARNTIYVNPAKLTEVVKFDQSLKSLLQGIDVWTFSNRYEDGVIYSQHRMIRNTNSQPRQPPRPTDEKLFSILPTTTTILIANSDANLTELWQQVKANLSLKYQRSGIDLLRHLEARTALVLLPSPARAPVPALVPPMLLIFPIQDRANLEAALTELKRTKITRKGKPLRFLAPIKHQGVELQPIQLQFGLIFSLNGGYALLDNYWVIGTPLDGVESAINAFTGQAATLVHTKMPDLLNRPSHSHIQIQPNLLIPELKRLPPVAALLLSQLIDPKLIRRITDNISPLEALGLITAGITFNHDAVDAEIQIILEEK
ncbi:hypothetical protein C6502_06575 [Candidatus Poribacteria bacterium]|nr:MAG: hypothetical protein C6502_06575 [Candidatus Poribacteria bacterium]